MDLEQVKTIKDLNDYLFCHPSPVAADILQQAINFFAKECRKENGAKDWRSIKERKKLGLKFQLKDDTKIDTNIVQALRNWVLFPGYGHDLGADFLGAVVSNAIGKIGNPRNEVHRILDFLRDHNNS